MRYGVLILLCIGCGQSDCIVADTPVIVAGTGTLATDQGAFTMDSVAWMEPSAPTLTKSVSFAVEFGNAPSVECNGVAWSSLVHGVLVDVSQACVVIDGSSGAETPLTDATLSVTSTLDATNEGTLTLRFDASDRQAGLAISGLVATVSFAHAACPSAGCGINLSNV